MLRIAQTPDAIYLDARSGRWVQTAGGPRVLYSTDYDGNFYTLTPAP